MKWLVEQGADVNALTDDGAPPSWMVDHIHHTEISEYLKKREKAVEAMEEYGGEWRPHTHGSLPRLYRAALREVVVLVKARGDNLDRGIRLA